ncbi:MAG: DsrE family protein [Haliea sp.]|nr:DsrE family protein [Haliea sp.]
MRDYSWTQDSPCLLPGRRHRYRLGHSILPQDEIDPVQAWAQLHTQHAVELVVCISSALKYGMLDETEAARYERPHATIHPAFTVSGLGQLVDACAHADRLITFGG